MQFRRSEVQCYVSFASWGPMYAQGALIQAEWGVDVDQLHTECV